MSLRLRLTICGLMLLCQLCLSRFARGDALVLRSGGELRGELQVQPKSTARDASPELLTIRTIGGALVSVIRDEVDEVIRRRPLLEEYETLRRSTPDTAQAQWELSEWCRTKLLPRERAVHLARIVELDPQHVAAHRGLGHVKHQGQWTTNEDLMKARGYVRYKGRFVLPQELESLEAEERENEAEKGWYRKVRLWSNWLESERPERRLESLEELRKLREGEAVAALHRIFADDPNEQKRLLYVEILSNIDGSKSLGPLVQQSLNDESDQVRTLAVRGVKRHDVPLALPMYLRALKNELNAVVNRAGTALGQLGDETIVPLLIEALVTRHTYRVMVPDPASITMPANGSFAGGGLPPQIAAMAATGQIASLQIQSPTPPRMKQVSYEQDEQNPSVLTALTMLTGEDFGFDEQTWRGWYRSKISGSVKPKSRSTSSK